MNAHAVEPDFPLIEHRDLRNAIPHVWDYWIGSTLLFAVSFATTFNITLRVEQTAFSTDSLVLIRMLICAACGLYGVWYLRTAVSRLLRFPAIFLLLYGGWSLLTVSQAESKFYSLAAVATLACVTLFVPACLSRLGVRHALSVVLLSMIAFAIGSWVLYFAIPEIGVYQHADGMTESRLGADANQLGLQMALAICLAISFGRLKWLSWNAVVPLVLFLSATLLATQSRAALIGVCCGMIVIAFHALTGIWRPLIASSFVAVASLGLLLAPPTLDRLIDSTARSGDEREVYTFNGRTEIWEYSWEMAASSPWLGCGYGASRYALSEFRNSGYEFDTLHHAHNQLLNVVLCTGVIGGLLVALMIFTQLLRQFVVPNATADALAMVIIVVGLLEVVLFGPMPRVAMIVWMVIVFWPSATDAIENRFARQPEAHSDKSDSSTAARRHAFATSPGGAR